MSEPEVMLWVRLRKLRDDGYHFRRQAPFKGYYLDFVCYARRIVVEVDGGQHGEDMQADHDIVRDTILRRHGFTVLRFSARAVRREIGWVMDRISLAVQTAGVVREEQSGMPNLRRTSPP